MSLRLRLALWYGGLTGVVVLLVGLLTYALHTRAHYDDLDFVLASATAHALAVVGELAPGGPGSPPVTIAPSIPTGVVVQVYTRAGQLLAASPGANPLAGIAPAAILAAPPAVPYDPLVGLVPAGTMSVTSAGRFGLVPAPDGARWRLYVLPTGQGAPVVVALAPLDRLDASVARLRELVAVLVPAGALLTFATGWLLAGSALRPVTALTATAEAITQSGALSHRVPVTPSQDELGRMARTFNTMLSSVERASETQQRFVADASHELRAPLTAIQGNLDLLGRRPDLPESARQEALAEARREAHRLSQLVADLLALARADAGVALRRERVELDRVSLAAVLEARHLDGGREIAVEELEPVVVLGDPDRLKQLLLILLDNALKYTPPDGQVALRIGRQGPDAAVTIRDTGIGILPADLPHVFERFYRADPARGRDPGGTGLGLAIARWIVEQHGGRIALESTPGAGTQATVRLPALGD